MNPVPNEQRCTTFFERKPKGLRYVTRRWRCPRKRLKGYDKCSYCLPPWRREPPAPQGEQG